MGPINHVFSVLCQFEFFKDSIRIFTSKKSNDNHFLVFIYQLGPEVLTFLKFSVYSYMHSLVDVTGIDLSKLKNYNLFFNSDDLVMESKFFEKTVAYNTLDYTSNSRYIFFYFLNNSEMKHSISDVYFNANWLERELVEFFNIKLTNRSDTRNLLLDYNFTANPLLKNYPTEGHQEIFFNHLSYNLEYVNNEFVEL